MLTPKNKKKEEEGGRKVKKMILYDNNYKLEQLPLSKYDAYLWDLRWSIQLPV